MSKKNKFELRKLKKEIELLEKRWWKKAEYLRIIIPVFFGILSLIYAFSSGLIDKKKMNLEITKKLLQYDIVRFNDKKDSLTSINDSLTQNLKFLQLKNKQLSTKFDSISYLLIFQEGELKKKDDRLKISKSKEYKLACDLQINKISERLQLLNGEIRLAGDNFLEKQAVKNNNGKYISIKDYSKTESYRINIQNYRNYLITFRDSLFNKRFSTNELTKCRDLYLIGTITPKKPFVRKLQLADDDDDFENYEKEILNTFLIVQKK